MSMDLDDDAPVAIGGQSQQTGATYVSQSQSLVPLPETETWPNEGLKC